MELGDILVLLVIGALAGRAAASILGEPGDLVRTTVIGVAGAVVGSFVFRVFDLSLPDELEASISLADVVIAFLGALLVIVVLRRL